MNKKCPICESKVQYKVYGETMTEESYLICENGCYTEIFLYGHTEVTVFYKVFQYNYNENIREKQKLIDEEIEYWKKDMRYLGELIEGKQNVTDTTISFKINEKLGVGTVSKKAIANIKLGDFK